MLEDLQEEVTGTLRKKEMVLWVSGAMEAREKGGRGRPAEHDRGDREM